MPGFWGKKRVFNLRSNNTYKVASNLGMEHLQQEKKTEATTDATNARLFGQISQNQPNDTIHFAFHPAAGYFLIRKKVPHLLLDPLDSGDVVAGGNIFPLKCWDERLKRLASSCDDGGKLRKTQLFLERSPTCPFTVTNKMKKSNAQDQDHKHDYSNTHETTPKWYCE